MKYLYELGIMGNIERLFNQAKEQSNKSVITEGKVVEVTESDLKNRADIDYIAMMADIPLEVEVEENE